MSDEFSDLDDMLGFLAEEGPGERDRGEHLSPEILAAYVANKLPPEADLQVRNHLAGCKSCRELLLELEEMLVPVTAGTIADAEEEMDWRRLQEELEQPEKIPNPVRMRRPELAYSSARSLRFYQALAAMLGTLVVGLTLYATWHHSGMEVLAPTEESIYFATTRGGQPDKPLAIRLPCALAYSTSTEYSNYRIEISAGTASPTYSLNTHLATGVIPLSTGSLKPGAYRLSLLGLKDGRAVPIGIPRTLVVEP